MVLAVSAALLAVSSPSAGEAIHKWVDDQGVTHYSEDVPEAQQDVARPVDVPVQYAPEADSAADYYSITNQVKRLEASRSARAKARREAEALRLQKRREQRQQAELALEQAQARGEGDHSVIVPALGHTHYRHTLPHHRVPGRRHWGRIDGIRQGFGAHYHHSRRSLSHRGGLSGRHGARGHASGRSDAGAAFDADGGLFGGH